MYNDLTEGGYNIPEALSKDVSRFVDEDYAGDPIKVPSSEFVEVHISYKGWVEENDGATISLCNLPPNTMALRIYIIA